MPLTKPSQDLKRYLQGIASDLKWSAVDLGRITDWLSQSGNEADAQAALKMCTVFHAGEDRLTIYSNEVKGGRITRTANNTDDSAIRAGLLPRLQNTALPRHHSGEKMMPPDLSKTTKY